MDACTDYDLENTCRSCLANSNEMCPIFGMQDNADPSPALVELIMECTQVKILKDDGMPCKICNKCATDLQNAYAYKKKCEESDLKLRQYIERKCLGIKIKIENEFKVENTDDEDPLHEQLSKGFDVQAETVYNESDNDFTYDPVDDPKDSDYEYDEKKERKKSKRGFHCQICNKILADKRSLKLHIRLHTGKNLKKCETCGKGFSKKNHLDRHMLSHLKKEYRCDYCPEVFESFQQRRVHLHSHNTAEKPKKVKQTRGRKPNKSKEIVAENVFDSFYYLGSPNGHKKCCCKICNQTFNRIYLLRKHLVWHMEDLTSFSNIDLKLKPNLFDFDIYSEANENLQILVQNSIKSNKTQRFYQILNEKAWELSISDSETEKESDTECEIDGNQIDGQIKLKKNEYVCSKCPKSFNRIYKIMLHMKNDHDAADFDSKCILCMKVFPNNEILEKHLRSQCENMTKSISCTVCNMKFLWSNSCDLHVERMHSTQDKSHKDRSIKGKPKEKSFSCDMCPKAFFRAEHLDRHRKIHMPAEKRFTCDICNKKFNRKDNLKSHMRVHKQEKETTDKHLCVYCGRSFSNSSNLIVHMRRHTGEKPYKCDLCDKGFPRSSDLQCHRRTHTGEKPCLCTICGKGFSRSNKLVRHMRIHTGVRPYKCPYCERAFTQSNDLTLHIRRHTGDKPYVCGVCGDRFIQGTALQTHRRVQGHFEENQPTPFASISVNNPSRYTNANRVNRIGLIPNDPPPLAPLTPIIKQEIKPTLTIPLNVAPKTEMTSPTGGQHSEPTLTNLSTASTTLANSSTPAIRSATANYGIPGAPYIPNGNPFLMQNLEMPSMFAISHFNQGYN